MLIDIHFIDKNEYFSYFTSITILHLADLDKYAFTQKLNKYKLMERKEFFWYMAAQNFFLNRKLFRRLRLTPHIFISILFRVKRDFGHFFQPLLSLIHARWVST